MRVVARALCIAGLAAAVVVPPAHATLPGTNGRIAYVGGEGGIYLINPDGTGRTQILPSDRRTDDGPAFSPDRQRIALSYNLDLQVMDPDGGHLANLTPGSPQSEFHPSWSPDGRIAFADGNYIGIMSPGGPVTHVTDGTFYADEPAWSPDGTKIAFDRSVPGEPGNFDIYTMNADGSGVARVTDSSGPGVMQEFAPDWSPDGSKIAYAIWQGDIWTVNADGTGEQNLTNSPEVESNPSWSPDGTKIAFARETYHETSCAPPHCVTESWWDLMTMNPDGSGVQNITNTIRGTTEQYPSWESIRPAEPPGYVRPKRATPMRFSLVPAFAACSTPNRQHGPPLAFGSCAPAQGASNVLTVGTPEVTGTEAESAGSLRVSVTQGNPATPADEAQVVLAMQLTDVRRRADISDYAGELRLAMTLRLTDKLSSTGFTSSTAGTVEGDIELSAAATCAPTADAAVGSTCTLATTADALLPGGVTEGKRTVWELGESRIFDGGNDGEAETEPNTLFARPGLFVP